MLKTQECVHEMMKALDLPLPNDEGGPSIEGLDKIRFQLGDLYYNLITEEMNELLTAMKNLQAALYDKNEDHILHWWSEVIDGVCDTTVVMHNLTNAMGVDIEPFFDEVHRTNMEKADGPLREDGKRLKPPGWKPPRIEEMLKELLGGEND